MYIYAQIESEVGLKKPMYRSCIDLLYYVSLLYRKEGKNWCRVKLPLDADLVSV